MAEKKFHSLHILVVREKGKCVVGRWPLQNIIMMTIENEIDQLPMFHEFHEVCNAPTQKTVTDNTNLWTRYFEPPF